MITFNELRITQDAKELRINATLEYPTIFEDAYISSLIIDAGDTFVESGPSSEPIYTKTYTQGTLTISESLDFEALTKSLSDNIFFVYIVVEGLPASYDECMYGPAVNVGVVVNLYPFYQKTMCFMKEMTNECESPDDLIDSILRLKALELSIYTGNYTQAIEFWNKYFKHHVPVSPPCKCGKRG